jgi:hypothetical protein
MQKFTEGIERVYTDLDETYGDQQDQQIFDILSDMEADIETGNVSQEEIVDKVADAIVVTTELGVKIEEAVEKFFFQLGLDSIRPDRRARDYRGQTGEGTLNAAAQPTEGLTDDFLVGRIYRILTGMIRSPERGGVNPDGESPLNDVFGTIRDIISDIKKSHPEFK